MWSFPDRLNSVQTNGQPISKADASNNKRAGFDSGEPCPRRPYPISCGADGNLKVTRLRLIALSISLAAIGVAGVVGTRCLGAKVDDRDPDSLLNYADSLSWNNNWIKAEPFYHQAELLFSKQHRDSKALYARVSQIPPNSENSSLTATIFGLTNDLASPAAADPETRLRILTIRGMLETNYDAASARSTWTQVADLARHRGHLQLALRATGEQGIAASSARTI